MFAISAWFEKARGSHRNLTTTGTTVSSGKLQLNKQNRETGVNDLSSHNTA